MLDLKYFEKKTDSIKNILNNYVSAGKKIFATSSFQTQSLPLLHILSQIDGCKKIVMTNTGFLFPQTIEFAYEISDMYKLDLVLVESSLPKSRQMNSNSQFFYASDPDYCCYINKVLPLEEILIDHDVWINGVRKDQSDERSSLNEFTKAKFGCERYHPLLDWNAKDIFYYNKLFDLKKHPLEDHGYHSIGCEPCTRRHNSNLSERGSRWYGTNKTECGINTDLLETK